MPNPGITAYGEACVKTALLLNVQDLRIDVGYGTIQKGDLPGLRLGLDAQLALSSHVSEQGGRKTALRLAMDVECRALVGFLDIAVRHSDAVNALFSGLASQPTSRKAEQIVTVILNHPVKGEGRRDRVVGGKLLQSGLAHVKA